MAKDKGAKPAKDEKPAKSKGADEKPKKPTPTADEDFESGAPTSNHKIASDEGELVLITPTGLERDIVTEYGPSDAIKADLVVINMKKPTKSEEHRAILIFQKVLRSQLEPFINKRRVLGRVGRGVAKGSQDAPFIIVDPTDEDKVAAREYLASIDPFKK